MPVNSDKLERCAEAIQMAWIKNEPYLHAESIARELEDMDSTQRKILFFEGYSKFPLSTALFLAAFRGYRTLYRSPLQPLWKKNNFEEDSDFLLEDIEDIIFALSAPETEFVDDSRHTDSDLILNYERAMIEKRRKNPSLALNFINKLYTMTEKRKKQVFLPHQLFTFPDCPKKYLDFQTHLIQSRMAIKNFFGEEDDIESLAREVITTYNKHVKRPTEKSFHLLSSVRYLVYTDVLMMRKFGKKYTTDMMAQTRNQYESVYDSLEKEFSEELPVVRLRSGTFIKGSIRTGEMKKNFQNNLTKVLRPLLSSQRGIESSPHNLLTTQEKNALLANIRKIGDLSQNNPYNPKSIEFSNLYMFWNERPSVTTWFEQNQHRFEKQSELTKFSLESMSQSPASNINWANANADAIFIHSLRTEKIQLSKRLKEIKDDKLDSFLTSSQQIVEDLVQKSTGHLEDLSFELGAKYTAKIESFFDSNSSIADARIQVDFLNHYSNSYPIYHFLKEFEKKKTEPGKVSVLKTLKVNRINAIGRGLGELEAIQGWGGKVNNRSSRNQGAEKPSLAEKYALQILPRHLDVELSELDLLVYKLPFIVSRLEELVHRLQKCDIDLTRTVIQWPYFHRIQSLLRKYAFLLAMEILYTSHCVNIIDESDIGPFRIHGEALDCYEKEVMAKDDTASHPMFKAMEDELKRVRKLGFGDINIKMKLNDLYSLCFRMTKGWMEGEGKIRKMDSFTLPSDLHSTSLRRIPTIRRSFAEMLLQQDHEFCSHHLLTSRTMSARLVRDFQQSWQKND